MTVLKTAIVIALAKFLTSCGEDKPAEQAPGPPPAPAKTWAEVEPVVKAKCLGCHGDGNAQGLPVFDKGGKLLNSGAKARIKAGTMPPASAAQLSADEKAALLSFLGG